MGIFQRDGRGSIHSAFAARALFAAYTLGCAMSATVPAPAPDPPATDPSPPSPPNAPPPPPGGAAASPPPAPPQAKTDLYFRTFGSGAARPVIFLHGGPGANSYGFEQSAAQLLADRGFFVIVYDQRGGGRSPKGTAADYSYAKSTQDLADLIATLALKSPVLLPHSFGGSIALKFLELHPGIARGVILTGSPMNFPETYLTILERCADVYRVTANATKATDIALLRAQMFPNGLVPPYQYPGDEIATLMQNMVDAGIEFPGAPTADDLALLAQTSLDPNGALLTAVNPDVGNGYHANDHAGYLDFTPQLAKYKDQLYAIYGGLDEMISAPQLASIQTALAADHFATIPGAAHFTYVDQTAAFVDAVALDLAKMK